MNLEDLLSEIEQSQGDKDSMIPLTRGTSRSQIHRDRKENGICQGLGGDGNGNVCSVGAESQLRKVTRSLEMDVVMVAQTVDILSAAELCSSKWLRGGAPRPGRSVERATLALGVVSSSPTSGVEVT